MNNLRRISWFLPAGLMLLSVLCVSCISVSYQEENDDGLMPNEAEVSFDIDWNDIMLSSDLRSQDYVVIMSRKVNTRHYRWDIDYNGLFVDVETPEIPETASEGTQDGAPVKDNTRRIILNGEYYAMAFNIGNDLYRYSGIDEFINDESVSMTTLYAEVPKMSEDELKDLEYGKITEYNTYAPIIRTADEPLFLGINKSVDVIHSEDNVVSFVQKSLTVNLTFLVSIMTGDGVYIDKVSASVSGIPDRVQLMSGLMSGFDTYRVLMDMELSGYANSATEYRGVVNVLGIFPPSGTTKTSGPGILHLTINAHLDKDGVITPKEFNAGINLYTNLAEAGLLQEAEDKSGYSIAKDEAVIRVAPVLRINADQIVSEGSEGSQVWIDTDVIIDKEL